MNSPFKYGKVVTGDHFINRTNDIRRIKTNISAGINTILISPRRWGKSSLMQQIGNLNNDKKTRFAFIDFFNLRSEEEFLEKYSREIIRCSITRKEELLQSGKNYFKTIIPSISFGVDPMNDFSLSFAWKDIRKTKEEIINLPERVAIKKKIRIVVCIDEFQNIAKFTDNISFEQELRSYWQYHQNVTYCLYGSRRHMMLELFNTESRAFYRFGDLFLLDKISQEHWIEYIQHGFEKTGKTIEKELINRMIDIVNNHPDYLQQLCHNVWSITDTEVNIQIIEDALGLVLSSHMTHYQDMCDSLSNTQLNLLKAILAGETMLTSKNTLHEFRLGTPRNVSKNKSVLQEKDIIEIHGRTVLFNDPIFEYWLREKQNR